MKIRDYVLKLIFFFFCVLIVKIFWSEINISVVVPQGYFDRIKISLYDGN